MRNVRIKFTVGSSIAAVLLIASTTFALTQGAAAAICKPLKATGTTAGTIALGNLSMPIKAFNYPAGGVMEPAKNTTSAGLSERHMPLSSKVGSSVIVWHLNYKGCWNPLNAFMSKKPGSNFSLTDENGDIQQYRIDAKRVVDKGDYKESWFNLIGPRQIVMITCTGVFKSGHYEKNMVFIATPI